VVIRSAWDYSRRIEEFLAWCAFVGPGDPLPELRGEVVVKPNVSAGARDTGRFGPATHGEALALIERIRASGRVAIVQAYLADVDRGGETALREFAEGVLAEVAERFGTPLYARVDVAHDDEGVPVLMELEAIEPCLYLDLVPGAAERFARAVLTS